MVKSSPIWLVDSSTLQNLLDTKNTFVEVFEGIGIPKASLYGSYYPRLKARILKDGLDMTSFAARNKEYMKVVRSEGMPRLRDDEYFVRKSSPGGGLKARVIKTKAIEYKCKFCGNDGFHNGKKLSLQLDHISGDKSDNRLTNLRFLCPNCHSQTDTFCSKKNMRTKPKMCSCGVRISRQASLCRKCSGHQRSVEIEPSSVEHLHTTLVDNDWNYTKVGKVFGISCNAIRKRCKKYGIPIKKRKALGRGFEPPTGMLSQRINSAVPATSPAALE